MKSNIQYSIDEKKFLTRSNLLENCIEQDAEFNSASFLYDGLPHCLDLTDTTLPIDASKEWLFELRKQNKPLVLMFSGGIDSIFALESMIRAECPPDFILVYTVNPFVNSSEFSPFLAEPSLGLEYVEYYKSITPLMKNTKIWRVNLDEKYAEKYYSNLDWPKSLLGYHHGCDTLAGWFCLPDIPNYEDFIFIKGGDFPRTIVNDDSISFFIVDLQLGDRIDYSEKKCYDFIIDNPKMYNAICLRYAQAHKIKKDGENLIYRKNEMQKLSVLGEHLKFSSDMFPPQLSKGFNCLIKNYSDNSYLNDDEKFIEFYNKSNLKSWSLFLEAELKKPNWYKQYKKSMHLHKDWIIKSNSFSGLITEPLTINFKDI